MVLTHLLKITGLIQLLCNLSINGVYTISMVINDAIPNGHVPRYLPLHILLLLCIVPGYISLQPIEDKYLKILLLLGNLVVTALIWVILINVVKVYR